MKLSFNQNLQVRLELQNMRKQKKKGSKTFKGKKNLEIHPKLIKKQKPRNSSQSHKKGRNLEIT